MFLHKSLQLLLDLLGVPGRPAAHLAVGRGVELLAAAHAALGGRLLRRLLAAAHAAVEEDKDGPEVEPDDQVLVGDKLVGVDDVEVRQVHVEVRK